MNFKQIRKKNEWCFQKLMIYLQPRSNVCQEKAFPGFCALTDGRKMVFEASVRSQTVEARRLKGNKD